MKRIAYSKAAAKALRKMQPKRAAAIVAKVEAFANGETVDLKKLQGSDFFRIRVGQDRVVIDDQTMQVLVIKAGPRGDNYNE
jgi:mRNA interferase RelE/StbE